MGMDSIYVLKYLKTKNKPYRQGWTDAEKGNPIRNSYGDYYQGFSDYMAYSFAKEMHL